MKKIVSWGANSYGQLLHGHQNDLLLPSEVKDIHFQEKLNSIKAGGGHTLILTDNGNCYVCGSNDKGQLGLGEKNQDKNVLKPCHLQMSDPNRKIVEASAGWDFSFVLTESKDLYGFGSNNFGQLGCEQVKGFTNTPVKVCVGVEKVCCGLRHSLILKENGDLYSCGAAKKGQTGVKFSGDAVPKILDVFTKVELPENCGKVCSMTAGEYHSFVVTDSGKIFAWGSNKYGQLGFSPGEAVNLFTPTEIPASYFSHQKVVEIHSGWSHAVAVSETGEVYTWGRGQYSQLGREPHTVSDHRPRPLTGLPKPQQIATGAEHVLLLSGGVVYSWGWNEHGMCGTGDEQDVPTPRPITTLQQCNTLAVGCGAGHSFAILDHT